MTRAVFAAAAALTSLALARVAAAEDGEPSSQTSAYSSYELSFIRDAERLLGAEIDPDAEGKIIESVETVRLDPIEARDPAPLALNAVHTTTKDDVVRHEVLLEVGDRYRAVLADESARNIRRFAKVSVVACVALRGRDADHVRLVVLTKDVWSLIADVDFHFTRGGAEYLMFELEETNVAGRQFELSTRSIVQPESVSFGGAHVAPRFAGRFLTVTAEANVIVNRRGGQVEGSFGHATVERPLFSSRAPWSWETGMGWHDEVARRYTNAQVARFGGLPFLWRSRRIEQRASVTRSYGWARKNDVTVGALAYRDSYRIPNAAEYDQADVDAFTRAVLPVGETRVTPFAQWRSYGSDFTRIVDYETLGLQEDYRLGYDVVLRAYPVVKWLGSSRDLVGARAAAMYTAALGDGLARLLIDTTTEAEATRIADASVSADLRIVTPRTPIGRLVFDAAGTNRWRNYLNRTSQLGGEDRLRGWPTRYFVGKNVFSMNAELRSRPLEIFALQLGAAAFYDVGRAFDESFAAVRPAQSAGVGFRIVMPQVDRQVIRGDFGFPIAPGGLPPDVAPMSFFISYHQAFRSNHLPAPFGP